MAYVKGGSKAQEVRLYIKGELSPKGNGQKPYRYCERQVTMAAPGFMPLCVTTHTATNVL